MKKTLLALLAITVVSALILGGLNLAGYKLVKEETPTTEKVLTEPVDEAPAEKAAVADIVNETPAAYAYDFPKFVNQLGTLKARNAGEIPFAICNRDGNNAFEGFAEVIQIYPGTGLDHTISQPVQLMSICGEWKDGNEEIDGIDGILSFFEFAEEIKDQGLNETEFFDLLIFVYDGNDALEFEEMTVAEFLEKDYQSAVLFGIKVKG